MISTNTSSSLKRQERFESAFLAVSGDLKKPIPAKNIPALIEALFPSFPHNISAFNVREILEVFGRNGVK